MSHKQTTTSSRMAEECSPDQVAVNERLERFTDVEIELLLSGIEDYTWAIGHRCCHMTKFLTLRKHSWVEICFRVNFFGNTSNNWTPDEVEMKWRSLLKAAQDKRESNKNRESAIEANVPIFHLIQPLTAIDRKVLYLEEEVAWGAEMNPFLADFDMKFKRLPQDLDEPATEDQESDQPSLFVKSSSHRHRDN